MHRLTRLVASECESNENTLGLRLSPDVSEECLYNVEIILFGVDFFHLVVELELMDPLFIIRYSLMG